MVKNGPKVKVVLEVGSNAKICQVSERDYKTKQIKTSGFFLYINSRKQAKRYPNIYEICVDLAGDKFNNLIKD